MKKNSKETSDLTDYKTKSKPELLKEIEKLKSEILSLNRDKDTPPKSIKKKRYNRRREDKEEYISFLDNLPVGLFRTTLDGKYLSSNKRLRTILRYSTKKDLMDYPVSNIYVNKEERDKLINIIKEKGEIHGYKLQLKRSDNTLFYGSITEVLVNDKKGNPLYMEGILEDISKREQDRIEINKLATIVEQFPHPVILFNKDLRIDYVNKSFLKFFGYSFKEVMGRDTRFLRNINANIPTSYYREIYNHLKKGKSWNGDLKTNKKDGTTSTLYSTLFPIRSPETNDITHYGSILRDITYIRNKENEVKKLVTLVEQAAVSIVLTDLEGNIEYVNPWFEELTGYSNKEALGLNPRTLKSPEAEYPDNYYKQMWETIKHGDIWKGLFTNRKKTGEDYIEEATIFPIKTDNEEILGYGAVKKDITWNIQMERELESSYKEMELLKDKAESATKLKSKFLANVSHDLRTPLNGILGFADLLTRLDLNNKQKDYVEKIMLSGNILLNLINDILDMSKIESNQLSINMETYFLKEILNYIETIFTHQFNRKGVDFNITVDNNVPEKLYGDILRTQQILINLLSNSLKFTFKGVVSLKIKYNNTEDKIELHITDTGIGIPEEIKDKVFSRFFEKRSSLKFDEVSTGLGLSICKNLTQMMDGTISFKSQSGKGTTFKVELPVNSKRVKDILILEDVIDDEKNIKQIAEGKRILVADDNPVNTELIKDQLLIRDFNDIITASNGNEAIKVALEFNPDMILMDNKMPGKNGIEATKELRDRGFKAPVIIISAEIIAEKRAESKKAGANEYFSKPIDFDALYIAMLKLLDITENKVIQNLKNDMNKPEKKETKFTIKKEVLDKTKKVLIDDLKNKLKIIEKELNKKGAGFDNENISLIAHTYKGNADYFGLKCLETAAKDLDNGFKEKATEKELIRLSRELVSTIKNVIKFNRI
ncbi:MAG: PAS domain S-box protein [Acidobacteriota bacterium]